MSNSSEIYASYKARTEQNNCAVQTLRYGDVWEFIRENKIEFSDFVTNVTKFWDNDYQGRVYYMKDGRVAEYSTDNSMFRNPLLAVFPSKEAYDAYRSAMPMNVYLHG